MAEENNTQIVIKNLWKIYGKDTKRVFQKNLQDKSKDEIQNETGCIVGLRDINLEIKKESSIFLWDSPVVEIYPHKSPY